jgi:hypothetical protein
VNARRARTVVAFILLLLIPAMLRAAGEYRTIEVESLKITLDSEWVAKAAPGYLPIRFDITNLGDARVIEIVGYGSRFFRGRAVRPANTTVRQTIRLARGDRVRLTMPVPIFGDNENIRLEIQENGRTLERVNYASVQSRVPPDEASALIVADSSTPFGQQAANWPRRISTVSSGSFVLTTTGRGGTTATVTGSTSTPSTTAAPTRPLDLVLDPARLPTNWLGFTSLRAVVIGANEWRQLDADQKSALLTWTACGGDLIVVDGDAASLLPAGQRPPAATLDGTPGAYFFGRLHLVSSASMQQSGLAGVLSRATQVQDANWALPANRARDWGAIASRGFRLPIPGVAGVPARAYLSILVVFSILIGPANYWFLRRKRQQVLLVLTAPIISSIFIALLGGYVVAGEGFGVRGRAVSFTMLDQARRHAVTRATASLYAAGLGPSGGLRFGRETAVYPIGPDGTGTRGAQTLDLTDAQHFVDGVIDARSPANLETIAFRPARERLTFTRERNAVRIVNGLGATIQELIYRDGNTVYRTAAAVPEGGQALLTPGAQRASDIVPAALPWSARFEHLFDRLPDGAYIAVLARSPFWDPGVRRVEERGSFHVVFGWVAGQP